MDEKTEAWIRCQGDMRLWLGQYGAMQEARDSRIRTARKLGIGPFEIARLTGLSVSAVSKIIKQGRVNGK